MTTEPGKQMPEKPGLFDNPRHDYPKRIVSPTR